MSSLGVCRKLAGILILYFLRALVRPGRFDRHIAVPLPDVRGRVQIIQHHMKGIKISPGIYIRGLVGRGRLLTPSIQELIRRSWPAPHPAFPVQTYRTWSSRFKMSAIVCVYLTSSPFNSQAAIYAAKLHAKEVDTKHFDWARVCCLNTVLKSFLEQIFPILQ